MDIWQMEGSKLRLSLSVTELRSGVDDGSGKLRARRGWSSMAGRRRQTSITKRRIIRVKMELTAVAARIAGILKSIGAWKISCCAEYETEREKTESD